MAGKRAAPSGPRSQWGDYAQSELRRAGYRSGGARAAVVELLAAQNCCHSAQEVHESLRRSDNRVGIASVYRALDLLAKLDLVRRVKMSGTTSFEPLLQGGEHHHHAVCDRCGTVTAFEDRALEGAIARLADRLEYRVVEHEVTLRGACPRCRSAS